jgi:secreted trypsin-like serine protease
MSCFLILLVVLAQCSSIVHGRPSLRRRDERDEETVLDRSLIIGGKAATKGDYPYFAHFDSPGCGGTLIAPDIVLTAGHVSSTL